MAEKTKRTRIREAIAKAFSIADNHPTVMQAADNIIAEFPILREAGNIEWDIIHNKAISQDSKAGFERAKKLAEAAAAVESAWKVRCSYDITQEKGGQGFVSFAAKKIVDNGQDIERFISYWLVENPKRAFWTPSKMAANWDAAFPKQIETKQTTGEFDPMGSY